MGSEKPCSTVLNYSPQMFQTKVVHHTIYDNRVVFEKVDSMKFHFSMTQSWNLNQLFSTYVTYPTPPDYIDLPIMRSFYTLRVRIRTRLRDAINCFSVSSLLHATVITHHAVKTHGEMEVKLHIFLTYTDRGAWSASHPGRYTPGKIARNAR
jgi:hypothetical protein